MSDEFKQQSIIESWTPNNDKEFVLMFEDDIEVAPSYFDYVITVLSKYLYSGTNDYHVKHLIGISLTTPRYDETSIPRKPWTPEIEIGTRPFFLFQLACSWGALYFPWAWREYLEYYDWRKSFKLPNGVDVIPFSYVNIWERSWKRYLQEVMFATGKVMLYPNLPGQASFSTHHREIGEHTQGKGVDPFVDMIGTNDKPIFTVPLITDKFVASAYLSQMDDIHELPVIDLYHKKAEDLYSLAELGLVTAYPLREYGFRWANYSQSPSCILDHAEFINLKSSKTEKYITFHPQGTLTDQINQLKNAIIIAHILSRTLLLPPLIINNNIVIPISDIVDIYQIIFNGIIKVEFLKDDYHPNRLVAFQPFDYQGDRQVNHNMILHSYSARQIRLPIGFGTDLDILKWFQGCNDRILYFTRLDNAFSQFFNLHKQKKVEDFLKRHLTLSDKLQSIVKHAIRSFGQIACVDYHKPAAHHCLRLKYDNKYWRAVHNQNCNSTGESILKYTGEWVSHLSVNVSSIYVINQKQVEELPASFKDLYGDLMAVYSSKSIIKWIDCPDCSSDKDLMDMVRLVEVEMCSQQPFYLGNAYSPITKLIIDRRQHGTEWTAVLGMGLLYPHRNSTLPNIN